jgi:hypothetical protein
MKKRALLFLIKVSRLFYIIQTSKIIKYNNEKARMFRTNDSRCLVSVLGHFSLYLDWNANIMYLTSKISPKHLKGAHKVTGKPTRRVYKKKGRGLNSFTLLEMLA